MISDSRVRTAKPTERPYRLSDGRGLYLQVVPAGGRYWRFNYRFNGRQKTLALGTYPDVPLGTARERLQEARRLLSKGMDPCAKHLGDSAWIRRLILGQLEVVNVADVGFIPDLAPDASGRGSSRVHIRLLKEDRLLLQARAEARGMRPATYVSVLTRSHLRRLAPLPKEELLALRRSIGELSAIGRIINQIAKVANEGGGLPSSLRNECLTILKICEGMRDHTRALLLANLSSWNSGSEKA